MCRGAYFLTLLGAPNMKPLGEGKKLLPVHGFPLDKQFRKGIERISMFLQKLTGIREGCVNQLTLLHIEFGRKLWRAIHLSATDTTTEEVTSLALSKSGMTKNLAHAPFGAHPMHHFSDPLEVVARSIGKAIRAEYEVLSCAATKRDADLLEMVAPWSETEACFLIRCEPGKSCSHSSGNDRDLLYSIVSRAQKADQGVASFMVGDETFLLRADGSPFLLSSRDYPLDR